MSNPETTIAIVCHSPARLPEAKALSEEVALSEQTALSEQAALPLLKPAELKKRTDEYDLQLRFYDDRIELYDRRLNTGISVDFLSGPLAHRRQFGGGRGQAIARAVGLRAGVTPSVLDATAGLAGDAFVLATLGCPVTLVERSAVLHALLQDAIARASLSESFQPILQQGFALVHADAKDYMQQQIATGVPRPDVVYIDPMYPEKKKSALVKKDMQILQRLHGADDNAAELLQTALLLADKRVVVKRPAHAESLNERKPSTSISSKKTRYDIYALKKM